MRHTIQTIAMATCALVVVFAIGWELGRSGKSLTPISDAEAAGGVIKGPNVIAPKRYVYFPGTEVLAKDEVRVIACGTGMSEQRRGSASPCFVFEFGNGEKMIFDIGTGSMRNIASLMIPYEYLTKVFLSHLHTDHWGDLDALWAGGWTAGRPGPLEIWGPSGQTKEMGTKYAVEHFLKANNWDYQTRAFKITPVAGNITVHEFDYKAETAIVYNKNGIVVRSIPAIHAGDGPVSFIIEYAGMKLVYGGDTSPNKWFVKYVKNADFVIHEAFANPRLYTTFMNQPAQLSWRMCCEFHTSAQAFGKIMSEIKPRHAVAFHSFEDVLASVREGVRETYDGPVSYAVDMMVWNITKDKITERMAVSPDRAWAVEGPTPQPPPEKGRPDVMSKFIKSGEWGPGFNAQNPMLDAYAKEFKLQGQDWRKEKAWYKPEKGRKGPLRRRLERQ